MDARTARTQAAVRASTGARVKPKHDGDKPKHDGDKPEQDGDKPMHGGDEPEQDGDTPKHDGERRFRPCSTANLTAMRSSRTMMG